ncbi:MAG: hypothetical protein HZA24_03855 [Nitrospirae bacterium]|nr:hypothetical protein [Nitrospirota bacterium]
MTTRHNRYLGTGITLLIALSLLSACATISGPVPLEYTYQASAAPGPLTLAELQAMILRSAAERGIGTADRTTFLDVAYPEDTAEYQRMHGFGMLWVTTFSRHADDMPPRNVRLFTFRSGIVHLTPVATFQTTETDPRIAAALGSHRFDGAYLVPVTLETMGADVVLDFQKRRTSFKLGAIRDVPPTAMGAMASLGRDMGFPTPDEITPMLSREYPLVGAIARRKAEQAAPQ